MSLYIINTMPGVLTIYFVKNLNSPIYNRLFEVFRICWDHAFHIMLRKGYIFTVNRPWHCAITSLNRVFDFFNFRLDCKYYHLKYMIEC